MQSCRCWAAIQYQTTAMSSHDRGLLLFELLMCFTYGCCFLLPHSVTPGAAIETQSSSHARLINTICQVHVSQPLSSYVKPSITLRTPPSTDLTSGLLLLCILSRRRVQVTAVGAGGCALQCMCHLLAGPAWRHVRGNPVCRHGRMTALAKYLINVSVPASSAPAVSS